MPVLHDHAEVSDWTLEALAWIKELPRKSIDVSQVSADLARLAERSPALNDHLAGLLKFTMMPSAEELEALARIKKTQLLRESIERKKAASTCVLKHLFREVDDVGVPTALALVLNAVKDSHVRIITAYNLKNALFAAGKHDLCAMVKLWLVGEEARSDEERKERYRKYAAWRLEFERTTWLLQQRYGWKPRKTRPGARPDVLEITPERVKCLADMWLREANRNYAKSFRELCVRDALDLDMRPTSELPLEPPVALERKALNQLDKRAKTRKLAGPKEAKDFFFSLHREKKQAQELRNAQTKARKQKRAKARADKLAA